MSYCVNCGVELEASLAFCPLCNTPVINLNKIREQRFAVPPFPSEKGTVETAKRSDWSILWCTVLASTSITCGLLNLLLFDEILWSIPIIGICILLWVFSLPFLIYTRLPMSVSFLFDGLFTGIYLFMFTFLTSSSDWFWNIALPITVLGTILVEIFWILYKKVSSSFLAAALYLFAEIAVFCIGIEIFADLHFYNDATLSWSAIVATVCTIICVTLGTVLSRKRLRDSIRKRLHF